ncbi:MAG TPA: [Fe-Fe] hydrogenase large subunit C-terminal domain-containing protein, partial [Candidatus Pacearchaeota archaeon]|nr:[Fe-Fe] hydrogenase large subunit C-terminal domain-containing protein [Candidatus Pacearchaeota archaeon]
LTTRELAFVLRKHKIDLKKVKPEVPSCPLCSPSGAGVIYGQSGGVSESALRTIYEKLAGKPLENFSFQDHPTIKRARIAKIMAGQQEIRVCAVNTMEAAKEILDELKQNPSAYHYVEVMSCYGGCIGGGGQPLPMDENIRRKRAAALLAEDKKLPHRAAHCNPEVETILRESFGDGAKRQAVFQTHYRQKEKENNF